MAIDNHILQKIKNFNWQKITDFGNNCSDLNDAQWRFAKGTVIELCVEKHSNENLLYVGDVHKDFVWIGDIGKELSVELKSQYSDKMYNQNGTMKKNYTIKLSNSNGSNKQTELNPSNVADLLIVARSDGAFLIDREIVLSNYILEGDGFSVKVSSDIVIPITNKLDVNTDTCKNLRKKFIEAIRLVIDED